MSPAYRRFWLLVPVVGVLAGLAAVVSVQLMQAVQHVAWPGGQTLLEGARLAGPWQRVLVPLLGGVIVVVSGLLAHRTLGGHGTSAIVEAIWVRGGRMQLRRAFPQAIVTIVVVSLGASIGREGVLLVFGAAVGSALARRAHLGVDHHKLLVACGATAGLAAVYNTPIGAALFGLEIFLGGLALELYGPLIFASVTATLVSRALLTDHPSYVIPLYNLRTPRELLLYLALGVLLGGLSALLVGTVELGARAAARLPAAWRRLMPIPAMLVVGIAGLAYPELYGNGYDTVNAALTDSLSLRLLLVLPILKLVLSTLCASSGVPGAMFTPTLFIGGLAGGAFGVLAQRLFPHTAGDMGGYVLVGMGAALAGSTRATLSSVLLLFELTGNYGLVLPLLGASVLATLVSRSLIPESIHSAPLVRRGIRLPRLPRPAWMHREDVRALVRPHPPTVGPGTPLEAVVVLLAALPDGADVYVVDSEGRLVGALPAEAVRDALASGVDPHLVVAADLAERARAVSLDESLWEVTRRALATDAETLAVVAPREGNRLVGTVSIADILNAAARDEAV